MCQEEKGHGEGEELWGRVEGMIQVEIPISCPTFAVCRTDIGFNSASRRTESGLSG
mgnify:CR=1 FL=1